MTMRGKIGYLSNFFYTNFGRVLSHELQQPLVSKHDELCDS